MRMGTGLGCLAECRGQWQDCGYELGFFESRKSLGRLRNYIHFIEDPAP
jgi:hypothetical protein